MKNWSGFFLCLVIWEQSNQYKMLLSVKFLKTFPNSPGVLYLAQDLTMTNILPRYLVHGLKSGRETLCCSVQSHSLTRQEKILFFKLLLLINDSLSKIYCVKYYQIPTRLHCRCKSSLSFHCHLHFSSLFLLSTRPLSCYHPFLFHFLFLLWILFLHSPIQFSSFLLSLQMQHSGCD